MSEDGTPPLIRVERRWTGADVLILSGLAMLVIFAFWEVVVQGRVFFFRDFALFFYPKRVQATEMIRSFQIPHWESMSGTGGPVLGAYQSAIFYPLALVYYLLPMPQSFMWFVVLHFFVSGAGVYYMMRVWGVRRAGAAFAAVAWGFSPVFVSIVDNVSFLTSLAWLPWCMAFTRRIFVSRGYRPVLMLAVAFAMSVLAGAPEPVLFVLGTVTLYAFWRMAAVTKRFGWRAAWRPGLAVAGALMLGTLLSGVELVPFAYMLGYSARGLGQNIMGAGLWSAKPSDSVMWVLPRFYSFPDRGGIFWRSQHWLKTLYLGVTLPVMVAWTVFLVRRRRNVFFAVVGAFCAVLALGLNFFVWPFFFEYMPGFSLIRFPVKFFLVSGFCAAVLSGFALDDLLVLARMGRLKKTRALLWTLSGLGVLFAAAYLVMATWPEAVYGRITPKVYLTYADGIEQAAERYYATQWSFGRSALVLLGSAAALAMAGVLARRRVPRPYGALVAVVVLFLDIGLYGAHLNPVAGPRVYDDIPMRRALVPHGLAQSRVHLGTKLQSELERGNLYRIHRIEGLVNFIEVVKGVRLQSEKEILEWLARTSAPRFASLAEADEWLQTSNSAQFVTDVGYEVQKEALNLNINLMYEVPMTEGFEPMAPKWHTSMLIRMRRADLPERRLAELLRLWGTSVVIDHSEDPPGFVYLQMAEPGRRAILAEEVVSVESDEEAEDAVLRGIDATRRIALFTDDAEAAARHLASYEGPRGQGPLGGAVIVADNGNRVAVEVDAARPSLLFVSDSWFPLFRAKLDGRPAPLWRANYAYRAVPVPAGKSVVEFEYKPYDFYAGLALTLVAIAALVVMKRRWPAPRKAA